MTSLLTLRVWVLLTSGWAASTDPGKRQTMQLICCSLVCRHFVTTHQTLPARA
jgi:hypothetical protein